MQADHLRNYKPFFMYKFNRDVYFTSTQTYA